MAVEVLPVSVAVPTIGRLGPLRQCLQSLAACRPSADEILIVDQSRDPAVAELVAEFAAARARLLPCNGSGPATARNRALREARHAVVAMTDDDCTVSPDWVAAAWQLMEPDPAKIVTGRVLPAGDPRAVPSTNEDTTPRDFTGAPRTGALFSNNMVVNRELALAEGGFDERFGAEIGAEDNDLCYRWLKAGRRLYFEPALVVWHHDWRTPAELERLYVRYMRGEGFLYAKHLRQGDLRMLRYVGRDLVWSLRGLAAGVVKRRPRWTDPRRAILRGLPEGLWLGWRVFWRAPRSKSEQAAP
jgi:GT2 family glycosyltransferase